MTQDDEFIARVEDYLETFDGETPLPERVRDALHAELPRARQVHARPGPLGGSSMLSNLPSAARYGLAAAVVVVVVLGAAVLNNTRSAGIGGEAPTQKPTATPAPSPSPSPSAAAQPLPLWQAQYVACDATDKGTGCLPAGTYQLTGGPTVWPVTVTIDLPAGWFEWQAGNGWDAVLVDDGGGTDASGWGVMFTTIAGVSRDPCDATKGTIPAAEVDTPQKLAAAIAAWPKFDATAPQAITVDGHSGLKFQLTSTQTGPCESTGVTWRSASGAAVDVYPMVNNVGRSYAATVEIIDTGHGLLVLRTTDFPQTTPVELGGGMAPNPSLHAADQVELHAILDSVRLGSPTASP
jgi:hypothetical protein